MKKTTKPRNLESAQVGESTQYCQRCNAPTAVLTKSERDGLYVCTACIHGDFPQSESKKKAGR